MKKSNKYRLLLIFLIVSSSAISQVGHIKMMIGQTEGEVRGYYDSLNSLKKNEYYKINQELSGSGDLVLTVDFALEDQKFYSCLSITSIFKRINSEERCVQEVIRGRSEFGYPNVSFVKDNFISVASNRWETPFPYNDLYIIVALFNLVEKDHYTLTYWLDQK